MKRVVSAAMIALSAVVCTAAGLAGLDELVRWRDPRFARGQYDRGLGAQLFSQRCQRCHSLEPDAGGRLGPSLYQIGERAGRRQPGQEAAEYVAHSILVPDAFVAPGSITRMPSGLVRDLTDRQLRALISFLVSQGGPTDDGDVARLRLVRLASVSDAAKPVVVRDEVELGERVFRGKGLCIHCHSLQGGREYEVAAPALFFRGHRDPDRLWQAIIHPNKDVAPPFRVSQVPLLSGRVVSGHVVRSVPGKFVELLQIAADGARSVQRIPGDTIDRDAANATARGTRYLSSMPEGLAGLLTECEQQALVAFLTALNQL